jgi:hypothetical protein
VDGGRRLVIRVHDREADTCQFLRERAEIGQIEQVNGYISAVYCGQPGEEHFLLAGQVGAGFSVQAFTEEELDLEDLYMTLTRGATGG